MAITGLSVGDLYCQIYQNHESYQDRQFLPKLPETMTAFRVAVCTMRIRRKGRRLITMREEQLFAHSPQ